MTTRTFGRYKVVEEIGRGAMGVVYRAVDPAIGRTVAIKAINRSYLESLGVSGDEYAERFQREAQVAGGLSHPHIVKIYDLGSDYLVMEYVEGQSLSAFLRAQGRPPRETTLRIVTQAAAALDFAHQNGIVHRDIKPANIMVHSDGSIKVMDFGLARIESSTLTAAGEILGSASYMAPEMVLGQPADARSDLFSLAVVAYEMVTGIRPFGGGTVSQIIHNVVRAAPRPAHELNVNLPPECDALFERALAKEPERRFQAAGEFAKALAAVHWSDSPQPVRAPLGPHDTDPGLRRIAADEAVNATVMMADASELGAPLPEPVADVGAQTVLMVDEDEVAPATVRMAALDATLPASPALAAAPQEEAGSSTVAMRSEDLEKRAAELRRPPAPPAPEGPAAADELVSTATLEVEALVSGETQRALPPLETPTVVMPPPAESTLAVDMATVLMRPAVAPPAAPPPAPTPAPQTLVAAVPAPAAAAKAAQRKGSSMPFVLGIVFVVLLLFGGAVAGLYYFVVRPQLERRATVEPSPVVAAEATPAPAESQAAPETAPAEGAAPEPAAGAEATPAPAATTAAAAEGTLAVNSDPPGATVTIARKRRGTTPLRLRVPAGSVAVVVEKEGFKPWRGAARVAAGGTQTLEARLEAAAARETRSTQPPATTAPAVREGDLVPLGPDVTPPRRVSGEGVRMPKGVKLRGDAAVVVEYVVDIEGRVTNPTVVESGGNPALDGAAVAAVKQWKYEPARSHGVRVRVTQRAKFTFRER